MTKIDGDEVVEGLHIQDVDNHVDKLLDVDGIFIAVGTKPASELLSGKLSTDEKGYIIAGEDGVTNIPGIFAAGDGRSKNLRQVVTAVSDGANCVVFSRAISPKCLIFRQFKLFLYSDS